MNEPGTDPLPPVLADLEDRVRKLEVALAQRSEADLDAVADRVLEKMAALAEARKAPSERVLVLEATPAPPPPPPQGATVRPPEAPAVARRWWLLHTLNELRLMVRMYFDPNYRISRTTQFVIPGILMMLVFDYFFFSIWFSVAIVSPVVERVLAVLLGIVGYKVLTHEVARYREVLDYLARYGR